MVAAIGFGYVQTQRDPEASFRRGLAAISKRDIPELRRELDILRHFPKYQPQVQLLSGLVFLASNDLQAALKQFDQCSVHPSTRIPALTLAGETFCRLGRDREAIGVLQQALTLDPNSVEASRWLGIAYYDTGSTAQAIDELRHTTELSAVDYRAYRLLGKIYKKDNHFEEAITSYQECLKRHPPKPVAERVFLELAQSLGRVKRYEEGLQMAAQASETPDVLACRAGLHYYNGDKTDARKAALAAIQLRPDHREALTWLGTLEGEAGHFAQAAEALEKVIKATPQDYEARLKLAVAYSGLGRTDEAQEQTKQASRVRELRQRFTEIQRQAKEKPKDADVRFQLGEAAEQLQLYRVAKACYLAALERAPEHAAAKKALTNLPQPKPSTTAEPADEE